MQYYALTFDFREPYQVLLDAETIRAAASFKMRLGAMLANTLHGEIKPMITQCCIRHLYDLPATTPKEREEKDSFIAVAKEAERRRCGHHELEQPLTTLECMMSCVDPKGSGTNKHRLVVASQDRTVREAMREVAGVPLIYMQRSVMILEPMAGASAEVREREEKGKVRAGLKGASGGGGNAIGEKRKREDDGEGGKGDVQPAKKQKKKGPKEPNPLSVRKGKKSVAKEVEDERAVVRKSGKKDPQAGEKALDAGLAVGVDAADEQGDDGRKKRKRKRKPKEEKTDGVTVAVGEV